MVEPGLGHGLSFVAEPRTVATQPQREAGESGSSSSGAYLSSLWAVKWLETWPLSVICTLGPHGHWSLATLVLPLGPCLPQF